MNKKWILIPALAGVLVVGGVALADDSVSNVEAAKNQLITLKKAKEIALEKVNGAIKDIELEKDDNRYYYDIEIKDNEFEYDIELDATNGEIIKFEKEYDDDKKLKDEATDVAKTEASKDEKREILSKEQVLAIAKQHAKGDVTDLELDDDKYEIEMQDGNIEYELKIHAYSGEVLSFEKDEH